MADSLNHPVQSELALERLLYDLRLEQLRIRELCARQRRDAAEMRRRAARIRERTGSSAADWR
jgi:hypothetical protein